MYGPQRDVMKLAQGFGATPTGNEFTFILGNLSGLPDISFTFGNRDFVLQPSDYSSPVSFMSNLSEIGVSVVRHSSASSPFRMVFIRYPRSFAVNCTLTTVSYYRHE